MKNTLTIPFQIDKNYSRINAQRKLTICLEVEEVTCLKYQDAVVHNFLYAGCILSIQQLANWTLVEHRFFVSSKKSFHCDNKGYPFLSEITDIVRTIGQIHHRAGCLKYQRYYKRIPYRSSFAVRRYVVNGYIF